MNRPITMYEQMVADKLRRV